MQRARALRGFVLALVAGALVTAAASRPIGAAPDTPVKVEGRVRLPEGGIKEPEVQYAGYVDRIPNPITELRPFDPRPECFVYLEGGPAAADAGKPPAKAVQWMLNSASFTTPILPVVVGTSVEIKNSGRGTHPLYAVGAPDLLPADPVGPGGSRTIVAKEAGKAVVIRSKDSPHVEARLVALPTRYFAPLRRDGSFTIDGVPPGKWTLKVWYRDGWLPVTKSIDVGGRDRDKPEIRLPDKLEPEGGKPPVK